MKDASNDAQPKYMREQPVVLAATKKPTVIDEALIFRRHGYIKDSVLRETIQGSVFKAQRLDSSNKPVCDVTIKRTAKLITNSESNTKRAAGYQEASVLRHVTLDDDEKDHGQARLADHIAAFIDCFESSTHHYVVTEHVECGMSLREFVKRCHECMQRNQLAFKDYVKIIRFLLWQLFVTVHWMHYAKQVCHLDITAENVMLENVKFRPAPDGKVSIDRQICVKLCNFGRATHFGNEHGFHSVTDASTIYRAVAAPEMHMFSGQPVDCRYVDNWSLGVLLFECLTNQPLYTSLDVANRSNAYLALHRGQFRAYLKSNNLSRYLSAKSYSLLSQLLTIEASHRLRGVAILQHPWFADYYNAYAL